MNPSSAVIITRDMLVGLPVPVRRYLKFSGILGTPMVRTVTVKQTGRIRTATEKPWMRFRAKESYSVDPPGFVWNATARYGPLPLLTVRDSYVDGKGAVKVKLANLFSLVDAHGPQVDYSSAVRFLSEVVWFPSAFLRPNFTWTAIDDASAEVSFTAFGTTVSGKLCFAPDGRPTNFVSKRYQDTRPGSEAQLWSTPATAYGTFCGLHLPIAGQAVWHLKSQDFTYIDLQVDEVTYDSDDR